VLDAMGTGGESVIRSSVSVGQIDPGWTEYKTDECPVCHKRGWCSFADNGRGLLVMCMRPEAVHHPGFQFTRPNTSGTDCHFVAVDGSFEYRPSTNGNGKHGPEVADPETRDAVYSALLTVLSLSRGHNKDLLKRGLSGPEIAAGRYRTLPDAKRAECAAEVRGRLGLTDEELLKVPGFYLNDLGLIAIGGKAGLLIPVMDARGRVGGCRIRPDSPVMVDGKVVGKYVWLSSKSEGGPGAVCSAHVPPGIDAGQQHGYVRLTEGEIKAHLATCKGALPTISIPGVGQWRFALPILKSLGAAIVKLAVDDDYATNPAVAGALCRAARGLVASNYDIEVEYWGDELGKGIDDVLIAGGNTFAHTEYDAVRFVLEAVHSHGKPATVERDQVVPWVEWYLERKLEAEMMRDRELLAAAGDLEKHDPARHAELVAILKQRKVGTREFFRAAKHEASSGLKAPTYELPYVENDGCTYAVACDQEGQPIERMIADFTARIVREIERHEAGGRRFQFEITATHRDGATATAIVDAEKYARMEWVESSMGSIFTVGSGRGTRDQLREAIQVLSHHKAEVPRTTVFTSLGWHDHKGQPIYCHAGGAIGAGGVVDGIAVELHSTLGKYRLPDPSDDRVALELAFESHLRIWAIGSPTVAAILATLAWRAVLSFFNAAIHFGGPSGNRKTSSAQILLQHFSTELSGRICAMSASWRATENSLGGLAHACKDSLLVIDDLKDDKDCEKAERIFQAQGDGQGRARMNKDQSLSASCHPRGSILSTGEIDPRTPSTLGRILVDEIMAGDINLPVLSQLQQAGDEGRFAALMSAYIKSLAGRLEQARAEHARLVVKIRGEIGVIVGAHERHPETIAQLVAAYRLFMRWVVEKGLADKDTAKALVAMAQDALVNLGKSQADPQREAKPGRRFLDLIASALSSGRCHLANLDSDDAPLTHAEACGWRWEPSDRPNATGIHKAPSGSKCVGWISEKDGKVYLDPIACRQTATEMVRSERNPQSFANVGRELIQEGLVVAGSDGKPQQNKKIHGSQKRCFHVNIKAIWEA
jgi:Domain of unknown function (DUF927)